MLPGKPGGSEGGAVWIYFREECAEQKASLGKGPDVEECLTCLRVSVEAWADGLACSGGVEGMRA